MDKNIELLIKKHKIKPSLVEMWQNKGHFPFIIFSEKELDKENKDVQDVLHVYSNSAINLKKIANSIRKIESILYKKQKRIDEAALYLEQLNIKEFKRQLATFLDTPVTDTEAYKREMKQILFDKRILYRALREFSNYDYDNHRRYWREEQWHLITLELLNVEKNALQKLYNDLFPATNKKYSVVATFIEGSPKITMSAEGKTKEEAFAVIQKNFPEFASTISVTDLVELNTIYDYDLDNNEPQDSFDYLEDATDENSSDIETDPNNFV